MMEFGLKTLHALSVASAASAVATARPSMKHEWGVLVPLGAPRPRRAGSGSSVTHLKG